MIIKDKRRSGSVILCDFLAINEVETLLMLGFFYYFIVISFVVWFARELNS